MLRCGPEPLRFAPAGLHHCSNNTQRTTCTCWKCAPTACTDHTRDIRSPSIHPRKQTDLPTISSSDLPPFNKHTQRCTQVATNVAVWCEGYTLEEPSPMGDTPPPPPPSPSGENLSLTAPLRPSWRLWDSPPCPPSIIQQ